MLEYYGAMGIAPGPLTWWEYERMFLGWKRQRTCLASHVWAAVLCAAGVKAAPSDMSPLIPHFSDPAPVPLSPENGFDLLKQLARGR